jgi:hypothetical protein
MQCLSVAYQKRIKSPTDRTICLDLFDERGSFSFRVSMNDKGDQDGSVPLRDQDQAAPTVGMSINNTTVLRQRRLLL